MTHFKISDEALSVAGEAVEKASAELEMVQCVAYDREVSEAIARAAIEAALPVMFQRVGVVCLNGNRYGHGMFADIEVQYESLESPAPKIGSVIYALKESK